MAPTANNPAGTPGSRRVLTGIVRRGRSACALVGTVTLAQAGKLVQLMGIVASVLTTAAQPRYWRRTVRDAFVRRMLSSGVEAIGIVAFLGIATGILVVVQYQVWVGQIVQSRWLGPLLVAVVVRELGPLLVNLVVIARSGSAIAAELALVHVSGEDRVVEGQGLSLVGYLVIPRVLALVVSVGCLTAVFFVCSFLGVYVVGQWIDAKTGTLWDFTQATLGPLTLQDVVTVSLKSVVPALLTGSICCAEGLGAGDTSDELPRAPRIAVQRSLVALFTVSAAISIVAYL